MNRPLLLLLAAVAGGAWVYARDEAPAHPRPAPPADVVQLSDIDYVEMFLNASFRKDYLSCDQGRMSLIFYVTPNRVITLNVTRTADTDEAFLKRQVAEARANATDWLTRKGFLPRFSLREKVTVLPADR